MGRAGFSLAIPWRLPSKSSAWRGLPPLRETYRVATSALALPAESCGTAPQARPHAMAIRAVGWPEMDSPDDRLAWDALAACAAEPNPFHESWYLLAALRAFDPDGTVKLLRFEADG